MPYSDDPKITLQPQSRFPWPLVAIVVAGVILIAIVFYLPRTPRTRRGPINAQTPAQPYGDTIRMSNVNVSPAPTGGQAYVTGNILNSGEKKIDGITASIVLRDSSGNVVDRETQPISVLTTGSATEPKSLSQSPLDVNQTKNFRIALTQVPSTWNHEVPEISIAHVDLEGQETGGQTAEQSKPSPQLPASDAGAAPKRPKTKHRP